MTDRHVYPDRSSTGDENLWLEEIMSVQALAWVDDQNARTTAAIDATSLETTKRRILEVLDSTDRIAMVSRHGEFLYNFWRDADHPRGLWRRTTLASYRTAEPDWDLLLDVDALCRREDATWVFAGADVLFPDYDRALFRLSPDGGDAVVIREFDLKSKTFVPNGFTLPHGKTFVSWIDRDTIFVGTDFGPGSLTKSSYPRQARRWRRGQALAPRTAAGGGRTGLRGAGGAHGSMDTSPAHRWFRTGHPPRRHCFLSFSNLPAPGWRTFAHRCARGR